MFDKGDGIHTDIDWSCEYLNLTNVNVHAQFENVLIITCMIEFITMTIALMMLCLLVSRYNICCKKYRNS